MWTDIPNLRHLRAFAAAVKFGGATRAGRTNPPVAARDHPGAGQARSAPGRQAARLRRRRHEADRGRDCCFTIASSRAFALIESGAREATRGEARRSSDGFAHFEQLITVAQLRALAAMQFNRNFTLAARELGLSQPSLHRAARDLERVMGATLFVATRQGVELTQAAATFARSAALAHAELLQGFAEVSATLSRDPGLIVVGSMPFARTKLLPDALNQLSRERPAGAREGHLGALRRAARPAALRRDRLPRRRAARSAADRRHRAGAAVRRPARGRRPPRPSADPARKR